jgi:hypothetical protein
MKLVYLKEETQEHYEWHISVKCDDLLRIYKIKYIINGFELLDNELEIRNDDKAWGQKFEELKRRIHHLMSGTSVGPHCCPSFREAFVEMSMTENYVSAVDML